MTTFQNNPNNGSQSSGGDQGSSSLSDFIARAQDEIATKGKSAAVGELTAAADS